MHTPYSIETPKAPGAVGPYSQALSTGNLVFTSGQIPLDPVTKAMPEDIREQTKFVLTHVRHILQAAGTDLDRVLKTTVYLTDIADFSAMNEVYATFFNKPYPARSCFAVRDLPLGARVEIEAVALL